MKALFIGGTGTISTEISRLAVSLGWELFLLNRGNKSERLQSVQGVSFINADISNEDNVKSRLSGLTFDVVANFINFIPEQVERDIRLFSGMTRQYIFISSASAYQKPLSDYRITESTPLANPYWQYSRDKIECEKVLMDEYRKNGFPATIVRPSHTYYDYSIPVGLHGEKGSWQVARRMLDGKPVIVQGDGTSLWTMTRSEDFARGFAGLMGNIHAIGEAVQITSDESLTWNQIYECIGGALGVKPKLCHISTDFLTACEPSLEGGLTGDKANTVVFDNSKLKRLVPGFNASIRFDQGVRKTVDYILSHESLQIEDLDFDKRCDAVISAHEEGIRVYKRLKDKK